MTHPRHTIALLALLAGLVLIAGVAAQEFAETVVKRGIVDGDLYLAGQTVDVAAEVRGDLVAAGQQVSIGRQVAEDVIVAAETVTLRATVGDDVRAAGRLVILAAPIADHVVAAGESVTLAADAATGSWAWMAGRLVQVLGEVGGELKAAGQEVVIGGTVHGDVQVTAERIRVLDTAHIKGRFEYRSAADPEIADGAVIEGERTRLALSEVDRDAKGVILAVLSTVVVLILGILVVGAIYLLAFPLVANEAASVGKEKPGTVLAVGFAMLISVPILVVLAAATLVGLPLALVLLALYLLMLLIGYVNGVAWVTALLLRRRRTASTSGRTAWLLTFALVLSVLVLLQLVPVAGPLLGLLVWLMGIGSLVLVLAARYRAVPAPAAA